MTDTPPPGWYPAPHANNESRYWDGRQWLDQAPPPTASPAYATTALATAPPSTSSTANTLAASALGVGILAFVTGWVPYFGLIAGIGAVVLGVMALNRKQPKGMAITGLALGGVALIVGLIVTISFTTFVGRSTSSSNNADVVPRSEATAEASESSEPAAPIEEEVAEPEQPAPEPPAATGSVESPYPQPYVAKGLFGGEKYSLSGRLIDPNASALVEEWNQFNSDAPAGFKYVVVELTMTGIDPDGVEPSLAEWDLSLATGEGNLYSSEYVVFGEGMPSMSDGPTLYPGSVFTGYTAYIVPESAQAFLLHDNGNYISF